jgi:hypothetical protein
LADVVHESDIGLLTGFVVLLDEQHHPLVGVTDFLMHHRVNCNVVLVNLLGDFGVLWIFVAVYNVLNVNQFLLREGGEFVQLVIELVADCIHNFVSLGSFGRFSDGRSIDFL